MSNGIKKVYNIKTVVGNAIHRPFIRDPKGPMVLYTKVDGYKGSNNDSDYAEESKYSEREKYSSYMSKKDSTYNSPRNIRRLFIGNNNIGIQYYASVISNNKHTGIRFDIKKYFNENINDILAMENTKVKGNVFSILVNPWVCSNIEEVYISPEIFKICLSDDNTVAGIQQRTGVEASKLYGLANSMVNNNSHKIIKDKNISMILYGMLSLALGDKRSSFKRLRCIGVINGIDSVLENHLNEIDKTEDVYCSPWIFNETNLEIIKNNCGCALICEINDSVKDLSYFTCSENIYKFDKNVLNDLFNKYREEIAEKSAEESRKIYAKKYSNHTEAEIIKEVEQIPLSIRKWIFTKVAEFTFSEDDFNRLNCILTNRE